MGLQRAPPVAVPRYRSQRLVITVAAPSDAGPGVRARLPAVRLAIFLDGVRLAECAQRHQGTGNGQSRLACGRVLLATHGHAHYQCQHCCLAARTGLQCHWRWVHLLHTILKLLARAIQLAVQLKRDPSERTTRHLFHFDKQLLSPSVKVVLLLDLPQDGCYYQQREETA